MRVVGLISGGKDSLYGILQCIAAGHETVAIANIEPETKEELDSYMFQSVGHEVISLISLCLGLPIFRRKTKGQAFCKNKVYDQTSNDEVEDLFELLLEVKKNKNVDGVSVGAIASDYQRTRIENVCSRLGLVCFAYLWRRDQGELLEEMINAQIDAIVIKVACMGLSPNSHLGMHIRDIQPHLLELNKKFGVNICGEGGEYETLTLDCPLFNRQIKIIESETTVLSNDAFAPVGFLYVKKATVESKSPEGSDPVVNHSNNLRLIQKTVKKPYDYIQDCAETGSETMLEKKTKSKTKSMQDIPFPFDSEENTHDVPGKSLSEHAKGIVSSKSQTSMKLKTNESHLFSTDTSKCLVSNTSGWCCIGNITGLTITDALQCLQKHLERIKYDIHDAVFVNLFIRDMSEFSKINKIYSQFMPNTLPPARACVETDLPPEINVIMSVIAYKIASKTQRMLNPSGNVDRDALHVRSISHWAPANIGPYSQGVRIGGIYYLAGQIPLIPGSMEILNKPLYNQCKLTLRHVLRVMEAMNESLNFSNTLQAICYVVSETIASDMARLWSFITHADHCTVTSVVVSGLPKNAPLEWEVLACKSDKPEVEERRESIEDFVLHMKRCVYKDVCISSLVCKLSFSKKVPKKAVKVLTPQGFNKSLISCVNFLKTDCKTGPPLCIMRLFYKKSESAVVSALNNFSESFTDCKVVFTFIPVDGCEGPEVCFTVTGVCHH